MHMSWLIGFDVHVKIFIFPRKRESVYKASKARNIGKQKKGKKVIEVLTMDYMSSEESEQECLSSHRMIKYVVRPLPWQSND